MAQGNRGQGSEKRIAEAKNDTGHELANTWERARKSAGQFPRKKVGSIPVRQKTMAKERWAEGQQNKGQSPWKIEGSSPEK